LTTRHIAAEREKGKERRHQPVRVALGSDTSEGRDNTKEANSRLVLFTSTRFIHTHTNITHENSNEARNTKQTKTQNKCGCRCKNRGGEIDPERKHCP
jgi:hypothetical protein